MTQKDNGPGPGQNYGETGVFTFGQKVGFWPRKWVLPPKKLHPKIDIFPLDYLGKGPFFFEQLFPVVARTW